MCCDTSKTSCSSNFAATSTNWPALSRVKITIFFFVPEGLRMLYLHGGGYYGLAALVTPPHTSGSALRQ